MAENHVRICELDGCDKAARRGGYVCPMHYHRMYRHGSYDKTATDTDVTASHGRRYKMRHAPRHPLAGANGKVYTHRMVLFDSIGPGAHACHWCGMRVRWEAQRGDDDALQVDHINAVGDDNRPENLVPACRWCNTGRAAQARADALRAAGWWVHNDTVAALRQGGRRERIA